MKDAPEKLTATQPQLFWREIKVVHIFSLYAFSLLSLYFSLC